jgi:hypothetical protein
MKNENFWLYKKHKENIEYTDFYPNELTDRIKLNTQFKLASLENDYNTLFDWKGIKPCYNFFFDFDGNDIAVRDSLRKSQLNSSGFIYIETQSDVPIIKTSKQYFIENWIDFINANTGQGSFCITSDFKLLLEFTDDRKYHVFSNFFVLPSPPSK